ncbi:MAG: hypothetical protein PUB45_03995 [Bacteroidales bacterium]|nr:hypothetical protein [Bacteroidales bacterium]MDY3784154.1 hypothetical protein [Candidatus Cryptobacteroides sp.]
MAKKRKVGGVDPKYLEKQHDSLLRKHRQTILFNQKEMEAIEEYCKIYKVSAKAPIMREAIMQHILNGLGEGHPTLF